MPGRLVKRMHVDGIETRQWLLAALVFAVVASLVLNAIATALLLGNSDAARQQREAQLALSERIIECTTPPEERIPPVKVTDPRNDCYARGLQQQGQAVSNLTVSSVVAAACGAANPGDVPATKACFEKEIARLKATEK